MIWSHPRWTRQRAHMGRVESTTSWWISLSSHTSDDLVSLGLMRFSIQTSEHPSWTLTLVHCSTKSWPQSRNPSVAWSALGETSGPRRFCRSLVCSFRKRSRSRGVKSFFIEREPSVPIGWSASPFVPLTLTFEIFFLNRNAELVVSHLIRHGQSSYTKR